MTSGFLCAVAPFFSRRAVVPAYFVRRGNRVQAIITGVAGSNGGAIVVDLEGNIVKAFATKKEAIGFCSKDDSVN